MGPWRWLAARPTGWTAWRIHANPRRFELPQLVPAASEVRPVSDSHEDEGAPRRSLVPRTPEDGAGQRSISCGGMERPSRFENSRFLGDKRTQLVYDLDSWSDPAVIDEIVQAEVGTCFGPDTLAEARNRGYALAHPGSRRMRRKPRA